MKKLLILFLTFTLSSHVAFGQPQIYTARGMTSTPYYRAQENTIDAHMAIYKWNQEHPSQPITGSEMHVIAVKPKKAGEPAIFVCAHDESLKSLTGKNISLRDLSKLQIQAIEINQVLDGIDYGKSRKIAFLDEMFAAIFQQSQPIHIWLEIKDQSYKPNLMPSYTAIETIKKLKELHQYYLHQPQPVDIFKYIIVSSINPLLSNELDKQSKAQGLDKLGLSVFLEYEPLIISKEFWEYFLLHTDYAEIFKMTPEWVAFEKVLLTPKVIEKFKNKKNKIMSWGYNVSDPWDPQQTAAYWQDLDAVLVSL